MKRNRLVWLCLFSVLSVNVAFSQSAIEILTKSRSVCQQVKSGYYEMSDSMKYMDNQDTSVSNYQCYFKKLENDSIFSSAFHSKRKFKSSDTKDVVHLYSGNEMVTVSNKDTSATIMSMDKWASDLKKWSHNFDFYSPLTNRNSNPLPHDTVFLNPIYNFKTLEEGMLLGNICFHIQVSRKPEKEEGEMLETLEIIQEFWINKQDYIPLQYSELYILKMGVDTLYQFQKKTLINYDLLNSEVDKMLDTSSISQMYKRKEYKPWKAPELLKEGTNAPAFNHPLIKGDSLSLNELQGNIVLLDFFYKGCYPCIQALPTLQSLHEKYFDKGLRVVGVNPYDDIEKDKIDEFMEKQGVTYAVVLDAKATSKNYRVSAYPTLYLVGKDGSIEHVQVGYGKGTEKELEKIIVNLLDPKESR